MQQSHTIKNKIWFDLMLLPYLTFVVTELLLLSCKKLLSWPIFVYIINLFKVLLHIPSNNKSNA